MTEPKTSPRPPLPLWGKALLALAGVALLIPVGYFGLFLLLLLSVLLPLNMFPGAVGLLVALLMLGLSALPFRGGWRRVLRRIAGAGTALSLAALAGAWEWNAYQASITIVDNTNIDTSLYLPFTGDSRIARLEGEASLRFSPLEDLPVLNGKASLFPLYSAMVNATYPGDVPSGYPNCSLPYLGTGQGYGDLVYEGIDILFTTAPAKGQEMGYCSEEGDVPLEFRRILLGGEGLVFFTSAANPVEGLTRDQLRGIYAGEITSWAQVGGEDTPVLPYQRHWNSDAQAGLQRFMGTVPLAKPLTEERHTVGGTSESLAAYRNGPGAIGFTYYAYAAQLQERYNIKLLAVDGVYPSQETIGQGSYPLTDNFYMVMRQGERTEEMDRFIAWALGPEGQELVAKSGYAPVGKVEK